MRRGSCVAVAAAVGMGLCAGAVRAGESGGSRAPFEPPLERPAFAVDTVPPSSLSGATTRRPLMSLFDRIGIGQALDQAHVNIYGHVEGGYTYNFDAPALDLNLGREFDVRHNRPVINQIDLNFERVVDLSNHRFDVGGRVEVLYGTDATLTHSHGLLDYQDFFHGPEYQLDLPQAYVDVAIPVGNGLRLRAGKFTFFKPIDPNSRAFYSTSFAYFAAFPFTLTGVTAYYPITDRLNVEAGFTRGWDQSFSDNNGSIDGLGRVRYTLSDRTNLSASLITGPEYDRDNGHFRTAADVTLSHAVTDRLTLLFDVVGAYQTGHGNPSVTTGSGATTQGPNASSIFTTTAPAFWYGASGYAIYKVDPRFSVAGRLEWYRDEEGATLGTAGNYYEATVGVTITPFPDDAFASGLKVRPELRYDYSSRRYFDGLTRHDQATFGLDVIYNF